MEFANKLETHYYLEDKSHKIDALVRNKCEAEILAILFEASALLDINASVMAEAYREGGFRDIVKLLNNNAPALTVLILVTQLIVATIPLYMKTLI